MLIHCCVAVSIKATDAFVALDYCDTVEVPCTKFPRIVSSYRSSACPGGLLSKMWYNSPNITQALQRLGSDHCYLYMPILGLEISPLA